MQNKKIIGDRYKLIPFCIDSVNDNYLSWLNDSNVNKFLEIRYRNQTIDDIFEYIDGFYKDKEKYIWGIYPIKGGLIGTVTLNNVNRDNRVAELGIMIGDINYWGKSASEDAINLVLNFAFKKIGLNSITGGCYSTNIGMVFTFKRLGFCRNEIIKTNNDVEVYRWVMHSNKWNNGNQSYEVSI